MQMQHENENDKMIIEPGILMEFKHKALPFKKILGVLKDVLTEVNIKFAKDVSIEGVDPEKIAALKVFLWSIQDYYTTEEVHVGVYLGYLYKMLRGVTSAHDLTMVIHRDTPSVLEITVSHPETKVQSFTSLKSIDVPAAHIVIPNNPVAVVSLTSKDIQKGIREMALLSKRVCLGYTDQTVTLVASGAMGVGHVSIPVQQVSWSKQEIPRLHKFFFTKYLEKIVRSDVCDAVELVFNETGPLVVQYSDRDFFSVFEIAIAEIAEPTI